MIVKQRQLGLEYLVDEEFSLDLQLPLDADL